MPSSCIDCNEKNASEVDCFRCNKLFDVEKNGCKHCFTEITPTTTESERIDPEIVMREFWFCAGCAIQMKEQHLQVTHHVNRSFGWQIEQQCTCECGEFEDDQELPPQCDYCGQTKDKAGVDMFGCHNCIEKITCLGCDNERTIGGCCWEGYRAIGEEEHVTCRFCREAERNKVAQPSAKKQKNH